MQADTATESIVRFAICSRIVVLVLSFVSNELVTDHNASDVFIYNIKYGSSSELPLLDNVIYTLFGGLLRWDANYFLYIANYGYPKENMLAFFPLFPFAVRLVASFVFVFLSGCVSYGALLLLSAVVINFILFVKCSIVLYELTRVVMKDDVYAYYAAIIFCVNPASIFFTAPYSETLYAYLAFSTILNCFNGNYLTASLVSGLSCATRSNGTLNFGFIVYTFVTFFVKHFALSIPYLFTFSILLVVFASISIAPFCLFQLYAYVKFCVGNVDNNLSLNAEIMSSWCNDVIPLSYSYVQKRYWNVGFLQYYEIKQIPNFLLAAPIIYILLFHCWRSITADKELLTNIVNLQIFSDINKNVSNTMRKLNYFVTVVHVMLLTLFCVFFVHIQVSTRMLCSSSPVFYWFVAEYFKVNFDSSNKNKASDKLSSDFTILFNDVKKSDDVNNQPPSNLYNIYYWKLFFNRDTNWKQILVISYCLLYYVIGTVLFSNFYPWT